MIYNPYAQPPYADSMKQAWSEGFTKGFLYNYTIEPSWDMGEEELNAFNEGVQVGVDVAANGIAPDEVCIVAGEAHDLAQEIVHWSDRGIEFADIAYEVGMKRLVGGIAGSIVFFAMLAITLPERSLPPEQVLPSLGQPMIDRLAELGIESAALYVGVGIDPTSEGCEIMLTPLFKTFEQARDAAIATGREWTVASWRTDQSGSFKLSKGWN